MVSIEEINDIIEHSYGRKDIKFDENDQFDDSLSVCGESYQMDIIKIESCFNFFD